MPTFGRNACATPSSLGNNRTVLWPRFPSEAHASLCEAQCQAAEHLCLVVAALERGIPKSSSEACELVRALLARLTQRSRACAATTPVLCKVAQRAPKTDLPSDAAQRVFEALAPFERLADLEDEFEDAWALHAESQQQGHTPIAETDEFTHRFDESRHSEDRSWD